MDATQAIPKRVRSITQRNRLTAYGFLLPNLLGFVAFTLVPIVIAFGLCFVKWDFANPMEFIGLKKLFRDDGFQLSFWNTIYYTVVSVPMTIVISMFLAILASSGIPYPSSNG